MRIPGFSIYKFYRRKKVWRGLNFHNTTQIMNDFPFDLVTVGKHTYGELNVKSFSKEAGEKLQIGNYVSIAPNVCFILGGNHQIDHITPYPLKSRLFNKQFFKDSESRGPIIVEDEVWIGNGVTILSGVTIGKSSIIAAGSVVTKDVSPYSIVGGNPAKFIKFRLPENIIEKIKDVSLADFSEDILKKNIDLFYQSFTEDNLDDLLYKLNALKK